MESKKTDWCWLNGEVMPLTEARVSVEDRGFMFADGVYEALRIYNGVPFELSKHLQRLTRSCAGIEMQLPVDPGTLATAITKLTSSSHLADGMVYIQVTRGPSPRNHLYPAEPRPTTFFYVKALSPLPEVGKTTPFTLHSVPDERWDRCWIKSIALLANVLARNAAAGAAADEAVFISGGAVTEGASSNLFMVRAGALYTHRVGAKVLPGVTRDILFELARDLGIATVEAAMSVEEAKDSDEIFVTSSTRELIWVSTWDRQPVGGGACGPITRRLHEAYRQRVRQECG